MRIAIMLTLSVGVFWSTSLRAELIHIEEAIEAYELRITTYGSGSGHVVARSCQSCKPEKMVITPQTIISVNGTPLPPGRNIKQQKAGGVVIFNTRTRQVVRLIL